MNFSQLIAPCLVENFFRDYFEKSFLFCSRIDADYYNDVLTEQDLDSFFSQQHLSPVGIRVVKHGQFITSDQWTKVSPHSESSIVVQTDELLKLYYGGATLVISGAENKIPSLAKACSDFEQETHILIQANIYVTPPSAQGFIMHYDNHDIFTLQIKGRKIWKLYDTGEELPTSKKPFLKPPVLLHELELNPGDLLYMPRGLTHEAFTTDVSTIHVNFSCRPHYGFHLLDQLSSIAAEDDVFFRKMIPNSFSSEEDIKSYTSEFQKKLEVLISRHSVESLLSKQCVKFSEKQIINRAGMFADALALENLTLDSELRKRNDISYSLENEAQRTIVLFQKQSLTVPNVFDIAIFLQDQPFLVSQIKGMVTDSGRLALAREFVKAGFLEIRKHGVKESIN